MRNEKTNSNDEFLVKQKEPLTLPPDFAEIPEPGALEKKTKEEKEKNTIEKAFRIDKEKSNKKPRSGSVEESILKRIDKWKKKNSHIKIFLLIISIKKLQ